MICTILTDGNELNTACRNEEEQPMLTVRSRLFTLLQTLLAQGYDEFYVNAEYGVPLWAAEFLLKMGCCIHVAVPHEEQSTNWTEEIRNRYFAVHEKADSVILTGTRFTEDSYAAADRFMLDRSDTLIICGAAGSLPDAEQYAKDHQIQINYMDLLS